MVYLITFEINYKRELNAVLEPVSSAYKLHTLRAFKLPYMCNSSLKIIKWKLLYFRDMST